MVTIAIVLIYLTAFASLALGILVLLSRYDVPTDDVLFVSLLGASVILLGLLMIALASGLSRGSRFARNLVTVYLVISIGLHVTTIVSTDVWDWSAAIQAVIDALIIAALWLPPGAPFYARRPAAASVPA
ncbi:hypothetical protein FBY39_1684 [Microbacterium sp. SLBN-146]|nr:hypothetical protein FBY39_1684 [Microbacterium sp. SLBN-146]